MFKKYFMFVLAISSLTLGLSYALLGSQQYNASASVAVPPQALNQNYYVFPGTVLNIINPYIGAFDEKCTQLYIPNLKSVNGVTINYYSYQEIPVAHGKVVISALGNTFYTADPTWTGDVTFPYVIKDTTGGESTADITITVTNIPTIKPIVADATCKIKPATSSSSTAVSSSAITVNSSSATVVSSSVKASSSVTTSSAVISTSSAITSSGISSTVSSVVASSSTTTSSVGASSSANSSSVVASSLSSSVVSSSSIKTETNTGGVGGASAPIIGNGTVIVVSGTNNASSSSTSKSSVSSSSATSNTIIVGGATTTAGTLGASNKVTNTSTTKQESPKSSQDAKGYLVRTGGF